MESLVEASAAGAEAINKALKAAEAKAAAAHDANGDAENGGPDRDRGAEATPSGKPPASPASALTGIHKSPHADGGHTPPPTGVRLHHRAVRLLIKISVFILLELLRNFRLRSLDYTRSFVEHVGRQVLTSTSGASRLK